MPEHAELCTRFDSIRINQGENPYVRRKINDDNCLPMDATPTKTTRLDTTMDNINSNSTVQPLENSNLDTAVKEFLKNKSLKYKEYYEEFKIGDLVWAKLGNYPSWPSVICSNPDNPDFKSHIKETKKDFMVHVRFCADNGRRSWITLKKVEKYTGSKSNNTEEVKPKILNALKLAIKEANLLITTLDREKRISKFYKTFTTGDLNPKVILHDIAKNNNLQHNNFNQTIFNKPSTSGNSSNLRTTVNIDYQQPSTSTASTSTASTSKERGQIKKKVSRPTRKKENFLVHVIPDLSEELYNSLFNTSKMATSNYNIISRRRHYIEALENQLWEKEKLEELNNSKKKPLAKKRIVKKQ